MSFNSALPNGPAIGPATREALAHSVIQPIDGKAWMLVPVFDGMLEELFPTQARNQVAE